MATQGVYQLVVLFTLLYAGPRILGLKYSSRNTCVQYDSSGTCTQHDYTHGTIVFNTFVLMQLFNQLNCRHLSMPTNPLKGISKAKTFVGIGIAELILQVLLVQLAGEFLDTTALSVSQWAVCLVLGACTVPLALVQRYAPPTTESAEDFAGADVQAQYRSLRLTSQLSGLFEVSSSRLLSASRRAAGSAARGVASEVQLQQHHYKPLKEPLLGDFSSAAV